MTGEADRPLLYYEDVEVGTTDRSPWYAVERDEAIAFARRWDPYPHHLSEAAAARSIFGRIAACAPHIFAISSRLSHALPVDLALVAGLGGDGLSLLAPVYAGTEVRLARSYLAKRPSKSRPGTGIVTLEDVLESPDGAPLFRTSGSVLIARRDADA